MEPAAGAPGPAMSLTGRLLNVFAAPGEVFEAVRANPPAAVNWLIPLILSIVMSAVSVALIYSQPAVVQQIHEQQTKALDDQVKAGKMTQAQADQAAAMADKVFGPSFARLMGTVSASVVNLIRLFWWGLVLWGLGRFFLRAEFNYLKALEVAGLAFMIAILGGLVGALLTVCLGKICTLSLGLLALQLGPQSLLRMALQSVDFFDLWLLGVMTMGLARLAGVSWTKAFPLTLAYWLVMEGILLGIAWFFISLSSGFK